ncbi:hypothetical protein DMENIID0001_074890 [Sergentomyia squamirostris]
MDQQKTLVLLRKEIPLLYKKWLNSMTMSFVQQYSNIPNDPIDFPVKHMETNIEEMSNIGRDESKIDIKEQSDAIATRIYNVKKTLIMFKD